MKKLSIAAVLVLIALLAILFLSLNFLVKKAVETVGPEVMKVDVRLGAANLSPFSGSGGLFRLEIANPEGYKSPFAILLGSISVSTRSNPCFADPILVNQITLKDPEISLEGTPFGNNLTKILSNINSSKSDGEEKNPSPSNSKKFRVNQINITGAKLHIHVSAANQKYDQDLTLPDIHLENIGTDGDGVSGRELAEKILTPLINSAIRSGTAPLIKQGIKQLENQGAGQINKALRNFLK